MQMVKWVDTCLNKEKKIVIISLSVFIAIIMVGFIYAQFFLVSHQLPEVVDKPMLSNTVKETIWENINNGKHQHSLSGLLMGIMLTITIMEIRQKMETLLMRIPFLRLVQ